MLTWQLHPASRFSEVATLWDELNGRTSSNLLLSSDFVAALVDGFMGEHDLIAIARNADRVVAMAVMTQSGPGRWCTLQPVVAPLGLWIADPELGISTLLPSLLRRLPGWPLIVSVTNQDDALAKRPPDSGQIGTVDYMKTPTIVANEGFSSYWAARDKKFKHNIKTRRNRLARDKVDTRMEVMRDAVSITSAIADFCRMEAAGWKGKNGTALQLDDAYGKFYLKAFEYFAKRGDARIYYYFYGNRPVAMDLCLLQGRTFVILKITYSEADSATAPSTLLREEQLREVVDEERVTRIEFYGPLMTWHLKWATEARTMYHVNCYRWATLRAVHERVRRGRSSKTSIDSLKSAAAEPGSD